VDHHQFLPHIWQGFFFKGYSGKNFVSVKKLSFVQS